MIGKFILPTCAGSGTPVETDDLSIYVLGRIDIVPSGGTLTFSATEDLVIETDGDVSVSIVRADDDAYRLHTITVNCINDGEGHIIIKGKSKIVALGNHNGTSEPSTDCYEGDSSTAPKIYVDVTGVNSIQKIRMSDSAGVSGIFAFICMGPLPSSLWYWYNGYSNIIWNYNKTFPVGMKFFHAQSSTFNGSPTFRGKLPSTLEYLYSSSNAFAYDSNESLPDIPYIHLSGSGLNWYGLSIDDGRDIYYLNLNNYRNAAGKMSSADMVTFLTNLKNRVGDLPATITINEYADYANPPQSVTDAVAALIAAKSTTTVNLGA